MKRIVFYSCFPALLFTFSATLSPASANTTKTRLADLVSSIPPGPLQQKLNACLGTPLTSTDFSISHRGAPLTYPEHTREGYMAAHNMGAGTIECDVTFTKDKELVCRHSQCDLHSSTNILETSLAAKCSTPPNMQSKRPFSKVKCCTSDISLREFKSLKGRSDKSNKKAKSLKEFYAGKRESQDIKVIEYGELLSHKESIELLNTLGAKMVPELKKPQVKMPFDGYTHEQYASAIVQEYIESGVTPDDVRLQSFNLQDIGFWLEEFPLFGKNAVWLDGRYGDNSFNHKRERTWKPSMEELKSSGIKTLAPPLWMLLALDDNGDIVPSRYAKSATNAGLELITWTLERSGSLESGGGWYYQTVKKTIRKESDMLRVLDVLAQQVGVAGVFSDWPASTTFYANCVGLR